MKPVLFSIGPFNVYTFGIFLALSFLISTFIVWWETKEELKEEMYLDSFLLTNIFILFFARITFILTHLQLFGFNILKYILLRESPGLSLAGGLFGGFLFLRLYCLKKKYDFLHTADVFSLAGSFSLILALIGEELGGASFGRITNSLIGIKIIGQEGRHHPVELYEAFLILLLWWGLFYLYQKLKRIVGSHGLIFYIFVIGISVIIFLLEFFKSYSVYLYGFSNIQYIALIAALVTVLPFVRKIKYLKQKKV